MTLMTTKAALILSLCSASAAMAAPPTTRHAAESLRMTVAVSDLDLATESGYLEAVRRISAVARHMCNRLHHASRVDDRESTADCTNAAIADADLRLQQLRDAR